ncbi:MAG: alcohol dehydrogenase catalytic domain-containing protein [Anaerolineae bacterium]
MRALTLTDSVRLDLSVPDPIPTADQCLIQIERAGICNTDLELVKGYMGFQGILGHEFVGTVLEGDKAWIGKRVVGEINIADCTCDLCQRGIPSQCRHRTTLGIDRHPGVFADRVALVTRNLYEVPDNVHTDRAVFTEPLAAAFQILEAVHISPRDRVIVVGAGKLGLLCAQVVRMTGADVSVVVRRERPAKVLAGWGIRAIGMEEAPRKRSQFVIDCTGTAEGFAAGLQLIEPRGTIVLKSTYAELPSADLTRAVIDEVRIVGSRCGPFAAALRALSSQLIDVEPLIDARYPLEEGLRALQHAAQPGCLKVLLEG